MQGYDNAWACLWPPILNYFTGTCIAMQECVVLISKLKGWKHKSFEILCFCTGNNVGIAIFILKIKNGFPDKQNG